MKMILILSLCLIAESAIEFKTKQYLVDPGRIYWPKTEWHQHPIEFSSNHAGQTVTMSIHFTASTTLSSCIVEITFPTGFSLTLSPYMTSSSILHIPVASIEALSTTSISISNIVLPFTPGSYGPFSIITRKTLNGQIIDMNKNFCIVGIQTFDLPPPSDSLVLSFADYNMDSVSSKSSILFNFTLAKDVWMYDTFVIKVPQYFQLLNPSCSSQDVNGVINQFNTSGINVHSFGCSFDSSTYELTIYGLVNDVDISLVSDTGLLPVCFLVTGFTNPNADYSTLLYAWKLSIYRFSTSTVVQSFSGIGPATTPGIVSINSWKPHSSFDPSKIIAGLSLFMDLSFTADHLINAAGSFMVKFSGVDLLATSWKSDKNQGNTGGSNGYYYVEPFVGGSCTVSVSQVVCSGFSADIIARNTITLSLLVKFTASSAAVASVATYANSNTVIDNTAANPFTITYAPSVVLASSYTLLFANSLVTTTANRYCNTGGGLYYITLYTSLPSIAILSTDAINIFFPASTTTASDYAINTGISLSGKSLSSVALNQDLTTGSAISSASVSSLGISFNSATASGNFLSAVFFKDNGSGSAAQLNLPYIGSNLWTRYESRIEVVLSNILYTFSSPITILPDSPAVSFDLLCTDSGKPGLPARINGMMNFDYSSLYYLYIDVTFPSTVANDLGSGLSNGDLYPFDMDQNSAIPRSAALTIQVKTSPVLTFSGFTSILKTSLINAYFPIGALTAGVYTVQTTLYYLKKDRTDVQYQVFSVASVKTIASNTANWQSATTTVTTSQISSLLQSASGGIDLTLRSAATASNTQGYIGLILPTGFQVASPTISSAGNSLTPLKFTSSNINFAFPGVLAQESGALSLSTASSKALVFTGITTAAYFNPVSPLVTLSPYEAKIGWNLPCESITGTLPKITLTRGILSPQFLPVTVAGRGPGSLQTDLNATFVTINIIPAGGYVEFAIAAEWSVTTNTAISVTGIGTYTVSANTPYKITGFPAVQKGSTVVISVKNLIPPANPGATDVKRGHLTYISTFAGSSTTQIDSWIDITDSAAPGSSLTVSSPKSVGKPTYLSVTSYPNTASTLGVSIYLIFSLENTLPISSSIIIKSPTSSWALNGDISNKCWLSLLYSSCTSSGNQITIIINEPYTGQVLSLLIDTILDTPNIASSNSAFFISTYFYSVLVDTDGVTSLEQTLQLNAPPSSTFTQGATGITIAPANAGELASYYFSLSVGTNLVVGDELWIQFPDVYDAYIGEAVVKYSWGEPNNYYLPCSSVVLGSISCYVKHWLIIITGMNTITAGTLLDITLDQVRNPIAGQPSALKLYLISSSGASKAMKTDFSLPLIQPAAPPAITIRSVSLSNEYLQQSSAYTFTFYLNSLTFAAGDLLVVRFPIQFMLDRELNTTLIACDSLYVDETYASLNVASSKWDAGSCLYLGSNQIALNVSQLGSWTLTDRISMVFYDIPNPEWGLDRSSFSDASDSGYFTLKTAWSSQFLIFAYSSAQGICTGASLGNVCAGFTGFNHAGMVFTIADYNPMFPENHILLIPGTQTVHLKVKIVEKKGLMAKKVVFVPKNHIKNGSELEFSSQIDNFFMTQGDNVIHFRASVSASAKNSLEYIQWVADEYSLIGLTVNAYEAPPKTLVEIYKLSNYSLTAITNIVVPLNGSSIPIRISSTNPPDTNFTVGLSFLDPTLNGIELSPISLTFTSEITALYFTIKCSAKFTGTVGQSYGIKFDLTGEDSSMFLQPSCNFSVTNANTSSVSSLEFSIENVTLSSASIYVTSKVTTSIYWQFTALNTNLLTYSELLNQTTPLVGTGSGVYSPLLKQIELYHRAHEFEPAVEETWQEFQLRMYSKNLQTVWADVQFIEAGAKTLVLAPYWLWAETNYIISAFALNESQTQYNSTFSTEELPLAVLLQLLFSDLVVESKAYSLTTIVAYNLGVNQKQLYSQKVITTNENTQFSWILTVDRSTGITPMDLYLQLDQKKMAQDVQDSGILNTIVSFVANSISRAEYQSPYWTNAGYPVMGALTNDSVEVRLKSAVSGSMCCIVESLGNYTGPTVSPTQVYLLLNRTNQPTFGVCVNNSALDFSETLLEISGLNSSTNYTATCSAYNTYPLWPTSSPFSQSSLLPNFTFITLETVAPNETVSFGIIIALTAASLLFV